MPDNNRFSLSEVLGHAPSIIAVTGVGAIVLSFVYQSSYFFGRDEQYALKYLGISDLADQAWLALVWTVLVLAVIYVADRFAGMRVARQSAEARKLNPRKSSAVTWGTFGTALVFLWGAYHNEQMQRFFYIMAVFQLGNFVLFLLMDRGFFAVLGVENSTVIISFIAGIAMPAFVGVMIGEQERNCPVPITIELANDVEYRGSLIANLNRGIVFRDGTTKETAIVPWSQVVRYAEGVCKLT